MLPPADLLHRCGLALAVMLLGASCSRGNDVAATDAGPPAASSAAAPDRVDPSELAEGREVAFGLKLPRGMRITFRSPFEIQAESELPPERIANYVRQRMRSEGVEVGAARTIFDRARLRNDESAPFCRVEVVRVGDRTRLVIRDLTPEKIDPTLSPEERWRKFGLDPNGRLIDPSHME